MSTKDGLLYVFAVERNTADPMAEKNTVDTMRRIKEELAWRKEEDSFPYFHDVIRVRNIERNVETTGSGTSTASNTKKPISTAGSSGGEPYISVRHPQHSLVVESSKFKSKACCNVCSGGITRSSVFMYHCKTCNWGEFPNEFPLFLSFLCHHCDRLSSYRYMQFLLSDGKL